MKHFTSKLGQKSNQQTSTSNNQSSLFKVQKTLRHGLPFEPTALAYDPIQRTIAVGSKSGSIRVYGKPGVEAFLTHEQEIAIKHLLFSVNEGALISITADDCVHLWNIRQRTPQIVQSLLFKTESINVVKLPIFTHWIYLGTEKGNMFVVNLETLTPSGYDLMWNLAIPKSQKIHPGPVTCIEENPVDPSKVLIGYENGRIIVWNLKSREVVKSYSWDTPLSCVYWLSDVKQFVTGHIEGSVAVWNYTTTKSEDKPIKILKPHEFFGDTSSPQPCGIVNKVAWLSTKADPYLIFTGGVPGTNSSHYITIFHGRKREYLNLKKNIVDFFVVCESPFAKEIQNPSVLVVLLCDDMIGIDLTSANFNTSPVPYSIKVGVSPVTYLSLQSNCPPSLMDDLQRYHTAVPMKNWPIDGGEWGRPVDNNADLAITGHQNGSIRFWDASGVTLYHLYTLHLKHLFDESKVFTDDKESLVGITNVHFCLHGRILVASLTSAQLVIMNWGTQEVIAVTQSLPVFLAQPEFQQFDFDSMEEETVSPTLDSPKPPCTLTTTTEQPTPQQQQHPTTPNPDDQKRANHLLSKFGIEVPSPASTGGDDSKAEPMLHLHNKPLKQSAGLQVFLVVQTISHPNETPGQITCVELSTGWGLLAFGSSLGAVIIDYIQKSILWSQTNADLFHICYPNLKTPLKHTNSKNKKLKISKLGSFNNAFDEEPPRTPRKATQRGKMLSIIRRDKSNESPTSISSHRKARKQGSGGSMDSPNSPNSIASDNDNVEANIFENFLVQRLCFVESYTDKDITGNVTSPRRNPTLWIGSYSGALISQTINIPPGEHRKKIPCQISIGGSPMFLKSPIINISALDHEGSPVSPPCATWCDEARKKKTKTKKRAGDAAGRYSELQSNDYLIVCAEKSILVMKLPSQNSYARQKIFDNTYYLRSEVLSLDNGSCVCLACVSIMGHILFYSLPQLKLIVNIPFFDAGDARSLRTYQCASNGHSIYMCSPTELQTMTLINKNHLLLPESLPMVFTMRDTPEPPRKSFINTIFKRNSVDRMELFGVNAGVASPHLTERILKSYNQEVHAASSEVDKVRDALNERHEKMSELEKRTEQIRLEAENFASASHLLHMKAKEQNKWF